MIYYISVTVLCVAMGLMVKDNSIYAGTNVKQGHINRTCVFFIFFVLFMLSGFRVAVGNDYWVYRDNFERIAQDLVVSSEIGFNLVVRIVQWFAGLDNYVPVFAAFSFITVFFFLKALYDQSVWFAASLFLLFANGFYFSSLNTVRYYLVFAVALYSMKFVKENRHLAFLATILVAATFHKSVLVVIPFYYLARLNWKKKHIPVVVISAAALVGLKFVIRKLVFIIYPYYEGSYLDDGEISYVNILKALAVLVFCLINYKTAIKDDKANTFYFNLNIGALIVFACLWYIPETTRIGYYLSGSNIFLIPAVIKAIPDRKKKIFWTVVIGVCYTVFFAFYLRSLYATEIRILPYYNWFFAR